MRTVPIIDPPRSRARFRPGGVAAWLAVLAVTAYRAGIRPFLIGSCKFCPSCSEYTIEAFQRHGFFHGAWISLRRLVRCHPFSPGGIDPVPERCGAAGSKHG
jgi:putative membrane protein insertion efficiency factor